MNTSNTSPEKTRKNGRVNPGMPLILCGLLLIAGVPVALADNPLSFEASESPLAFVKHNGTFAPESRFKVGQVCLEDGARIPFTWTYSSDAQAARLDVTAADAMLPGRPIIAAASAVAGVLSGGFDLIIPPTQSAIVKLDASATSLATNERQTESALLWNECGTSSMAELECAIPLDFVVIYDLCASPGPTSFDCPDTAIEGQMGHCLYKYELATAVPALITYTINAVEGNCRYAGAELGGTGQGSAEPSGDYLIIPSAVGIPRNTDLPIAVDVLVIDIAYEYMGATRCRQAVSTVDYIADPFGIIPDFDTTLVVPDISLQPWSLGAMATVGGYTRTDRAVAVAPDILEYTVITPSDKVLGVVSATISHNDGGANSDWGDFEITPHPDLSLLPDLLPPGSLPVDVGSLTNTRKLADDTSSTQWVTLTQVSASTEGTANQICLAAHYNDDGVPQGAASSCITVTGVKEEGAHLLVPEALQPFVDAALERFGSVIVPIGGSTYVALTQ